MPTQQELLAEAARRGLLPPEKIALFEEAARRGLLAGDGAQEPGPEPPQEAPAPEQGNWFDRLPRLNKHANIDSGLRTQALSQKQLRDYLGQIEPGSEVPYPDPTRQLPPPTGDWFDRMPLRSRKHEVLQAKLTPQMTTSSEQIAKEHEMGGADKDPWIQPEMVGAAAFGAGTKVALAAGKKLLPAFMQGLAAMGPAAAMEFPIGQAADLAAESDNPELALLISVGLGFGSGMTIEHLAEKGLLKAVGGAIRRYPKVAKATLPQDVMGQYRASGEFSEWSPKISERMKAKMERRPAQPLDLGTEPAGQKLDVGAVDETLPTVREAEEPTPTPPAPTKPEKLQAILGAPAGLEQDEEGGISFDPKKAAVGMLGAAAGKKVLGKAKKAPTFFSQFAETAEKKLPGKMTAKVAGGQIDSMVKKGEVKLEEVENLGIKEWLAEQGDRKVSKDEVMEYVRGNQLELEETQLGSIKEPAKRSHWVSQNKEKYEQTYPQGIPLDDPISVTSAKSAFKNDVDAGLAHWADETGQPISAEEAEKYAKEWEEYYLKSDKQPKFSQYTLPGGENYRELLLRLPYETTKRRAWDVYVDGTRYSRQFESKEEAEKYADLARGVGKEASVVGATPENIGPDRGPVSPESIYRGGHWDELNVLAHVRVNDRTDADGKKVLFLEEIQSDWHQKGKRQGYSDPKKRVVVFEEKTGDEVARFESGLEAEAYIREVDPKFERLNYAERWPREDGVPDAPFKKTWPMLTMKRMIREAAEKDYDSIAWTTGAQQAERYDLSKQVGEVQWTPGDKALRVYDLNGKKIISESLVDESKIEDYVGKEIAQKLISSEPVATASAAPYHSLSGIDLKVGGEGMKRFYDDQLVRSVNKYVKKWGAKVERGEIPTQLKGDQTGTSPLITRLDDDRIRVRQGENTWHFNTMERAEEFSKKLMDEQPSKATVHSLKITPEMKATVLGKGQPMFSVVGAGAGLEEDEQGQLSFDPKKAALGMLAGGGLAGITRMKVKGKGSKRTTEFKHFDPLPEIKRSPAAIKVELTTRLHPQNDNPNIRKLSADYTTRKAMKLEEVEKAFTDSVNRDETGTSLFDKVWETEFKKRIDVSQRTGTAPYRPITQNVSAAKSSSGNIKAEGEYLPMDTSRGCPNMCSQCYAMGSATKTCRSFVEPSPVRLTGKFETNPDIIRRFGETGDPNIDPRKWEELKTEFMKETQAGKKFSPEELDERLNTMYDWAWTNEQLRNTGLDAPEAHEKVFVITKLNSTKNFDPKALRNLEVSIDPLTPHHFFRALKNVESLLKLDPDLNIALRIRSVSSYSDEVNALQKIAVEFANKNNIKVLETRLRFKGGEGLRQASGQGDYLHKAPQLHHKSYGIEGKGVREKVRQTSPLSQSGLRDDLHMICNEPNISGAACGKCQGCRKFLKQGTGTKMSAMVGVPAGLEEDEQGQLSFNPEKALVGLLAGAAGTKAAGRSRWIGNRIAQTWEKKYAQPLIDLAKRTINGRIVNENIRHALGMNRSPKFKDMLRDFKREEQQIWVRAKEIAEELQELAPTKLEQKRLMQIVKGGVTVSPKLAAKAQEVNRLFSELKDQLKEHDLLHYSRFDKATDKVGGMNRKERARIRNLLSGPDPHKQTVHELRARAKELGMDPEQMIKEAWMTRVKVKEKGVRAFTVAEKDFDRDLLARAVEKHLEFEQSRLNDYYHSGSAHEYAPIYYDVHEGLTPKQRKTLEDEIATLKKRSRLGNPEGTQSLEDVIAELEQMLKKGAEGRRAYGMTRQQLVKGYAHRRIDMPIQVQRMMGLIEEAAFPVGKGLGVQGADVLKAKLFEAIANEGDWAVRATKGVEMPKNYTLVENEAFGALNGMYVRKDIWDDLREVNEFRNAFIQQWDKYLGYWKSGKVVLNPATQARNTYWNVIAAWLADVPLSDIAKIPLKRGAYYKAGQALWQGKENKFYQEADKWGLFNNTFYSYELNKMRDELEAVRDGNGVKNWVRTAFSAPGKAYEGNEKFFKMVVFIKAREDGLDVDAAARKAEEHLFNYADIPPVVKHLKRWGMPFLTFSWKFWPLMAKTMIRKPHKVAALLTAGYALEEYSKFHMGMTDDDAEKERKLLPDWQRKKTFGLGSYLHILAPFTDKWGNRLYWDTSNILPYGNFGEEFGQSGLPLAELVPAKNPFISLLYNLNANRDSFTGKDIYNKTMYEAMKKTEGLALEAFKQKTQAQLGYAWKSLAPPIAPGGHGWSKLKTGLMNTLNKEAQVLDWADRPYELQEAVLSALFGIKLSPANEKSLKEFELYNIQNISRSLAKERGTLKGQLERNEITKAQYKSGVKTLMEWQKTILKDRQNLLK